jgi:hypothetical protein
MSPIVRLHNSVLRQIGRSELESFEYYEALSSFSASLTRTGQKQYSNLKVLTGRKPKLLVLG